MVHTEHLYYVYILTNRKHGTFYIGFTSNLYLRMQAHHEGVVEGFTKKYGLNRLVYFESSTDFDSALKREKQLKRWRRRWKISLIEKMNPEWKDLIDQLT